MENETDVTRAQMDETRASLSEKLETLEHKVVDTVQGAASMVNQTVDTVKDAVHDTVENVKETFDLPLQMKRHPWTMLGGAIALGYLGGYLVFRRDAIQSRASAQGKPAAFENSRSTEKQNGVVKDPRIEEEAFAKKPVADAPCADGVDASWLDGMHDRFEAEIHKAKGIAIGTALGIVRDIITQAAPDLMKPGLTDVIDGITVKLGGEPIHGPVLKERARTTETPRKGSTAEANVS